MVAVIDTRPLFRPLCVEVVALLGSLAPDDWERTTIAGSWRVHDVAAHMLDTALRRLSFHRDRIPPPGPEAPPVTERDLVRLINSLNAAWIYAARRLSPRVLTDLYAQASRDLADFMEGLPDDAPPLFVVSWAGDQGMSGWLDIGREFTEIWHHGAQIRDAVGAGPFTEPRWLRAVLEISLHALPHAYRDVHAPAGSSLALRISGPSGGDWTLHRDAAGWILDQHSGPDGKGTSAAVVEMTDETAWRLLFNALPGSAAAERVRVSGDRELASPLFRTRSVIV